MQTLGYGIGHWDIGTIIKLIKLKARILTKGREMISCFAEKKSVRVTGMRPSFNKQHGTGPDQMKWHLEMIHSDICGPNENLNT